MVSLIILVAVVVMVPLIMKSTRSRAARRVRWHGIDWSRGVSPAALHVADGARLQREGAYEKAIAALDQALAIEPELVEALLARAVARHRLGRLDDALADYDRAIALAGPTSEALNNRGCLQRDRGDVERATADLKAAIDLAPDDAVAHVSLAEALAQRGDWDAALDSLSQGVSRDPALREYARTADTFASLRTERPAASVFEP